MRVLCFCGLLKGPSLDSPMANLARESLELVKSYCTPPLFPEGIEALLRHASHHADIPRFGIECRLSAADHQVDVSQAIFQRSDECEQLHRKLGDLPTHLVESPEWRGLANFTAKWLETDSVIRQAVNEVWLEYDIDQKSNPTSPSIFIGLNPAMYEHGRVKEIANRASSLLTGSLLSSDIVRTLDICTDALPGSSMLVYVGFMLSRPGSAIRAHIRDIQNREVIPFLKTIGWPGNMDTCQELIHLADQYGMRTRVDLNIGEVIEDTVGIEFFMPPGDDQNQKWTPFLSSKPFSRDCDAEKVQALTQWPGHVTPATTPVPWPSALLAESLTRRTDEFSVFTRTINHVKATVASTGDVSVKAYLGYLHSWVSPEADNYDGQPRRS